MWISHPQFLPFISGVSTIIDEKEDVLLAQLQTAQQKVLAVTANLHAIVREHRWEFQVRCRVLQKLFFLHPAFV
jgi:hypothetical protein